MPLRSRSRSHRKVHLSPRRDDRARSDRQRRSRSREAPRRQVASPGRAGWRGPSNVGSERKYDDHSGKGYDKGKGEEKGKGKGKDKGKGKGKDGVVGTPPPRPGFDEDNRLRELKDDPRYFEGALLGKAQLAALGKKGLGGRNTASFYAEDTLVRPAMRVFYGPLQKRYEGKALTHDDVVVVPDFYCKTNEFDTYNAMLKEVKSLQTGEVSDLDELQMCQRVVKKMCKYLSIAGENRAVRISLHKDQNDKDPFMHSAGASFKKRPSQEQNCIAVMSFGASREMFFQRTGTDELLYFQLDNGTMTVFARDVCRRWQHGMKTTSASSTATHSFISVAVMGSSSEVHEEKILKESPSDEKRGEHAFDGRGEQICHDIARPSMRILTVQTSQKYAQPVKHDDVIIVPNFICDEDDWTIYYKLIEEMRKSQASGERRAEWVSWHEGAHLLSQNPTGSPTFQKVLDRMAEYFSCSEGNRGNRFNWYVDDSDWKPFHHDSAAFNEQRARQQNCTIGISFGQPRELALKHAKTGENIYFPQKNGMLFYFGRDANIVWQHGINALPKTEQGGKGRISIILWALCEKTMEEAGSPGMLTNDSRDKGKGKGKGGSDLRPDMPCRDFERGTCNYGDRCRFKHER